MKNRKTPSQHNVQRSLFGEILDWLLAPLLFIWPISIGVTHYFANTVANYPYDQILREDIQAIVSQITFDESGQPKFDSTKSIRQLFNDANSDKQDKFYFHILNNKNRYLDKNADIPAGDRSHIFLRTPPGEVRFRNAELDNEDIRIAYSTFAGQIESEFWLIEVGETLNKRAKLTNKIITSVILPQFAIILLAIILVWAGLSQGLRSLAKLRERIESRQQDDLSPISNTRIPEELLPLIEAFNTMLERMKANVDAQQRFIADAAHQLRTPLAGLKTQAQLAMREENPEALYHSLVQINLSVDRASHIVNQLLSLARIESDQQQHTEFKTLDLRQLLHRIVENLIPNALAKDIDLGVNAKEPMIVNGSDFLLREMISNLIDNAIRYTPVGGRVTCHLYRRNMRAILDIEDNGIGISLIDSERVFGRFFRVDNNLAHGSGLGLAIARHIAEQHKGGARLLNNRSGKGCTARVVLPLSEAEVEEQPNSKAPAAGNNHQ